MKTLSILLIFILQLQMCDNDEKKPISKNVKVEFRMAKDTKTDNFEEKELDGTKIYLSPKVEINENDITTVSKTLDHYGSYFIIMLEMNAEGAQKFANLTSNNVSEKLAILVNGKIIMAPVIQDKITGGKVQITGNFTSAEVDSLFKTLTETQD